MITVNSLNKDRDKNNIKKNNIYNNIYYIIEKKIILSNKYNNYYILYLIPEFLIGSSQYVLEECTKYILFKLTLNGFITNIYDPNILLVQWN